MQYTSGSNYINKYRIFNTEFERMLTQKLGRDGREWRDVVTLP